MNNRPWLYALGGFLFGVLVGVLTKPSSEREEHIKETHYVTLPALPEEDH